MTDSEKKTANGQQPTAKSQQPTAKSQQPTANSDPNAAQVYDELVHIDTTGWDEKRLVEHKRKCTEALAEKQRVAVSH